KMRPGGSSGDAEKCAPRILVPIRGTESGEGWYKINPIIVLQAFCHRFTFFGMAEKLQPVPQPLNGSPTDKYAAFQGVGHLITDLPGNGGQQLVGGFNRFVSGI